MKTAKRKLAKRPAARAASAQPTPPPTPAPISVTLSPQTSGLVRWYCGITKHFEADTVEGAVHGVLERAKDAYEGSPGMDEGFNWLMEDVLRANNDDLRQPLHRQYNGGYTVQLDLQASALLARYVRQDGDDDPRDVISGAVESMLRCVLDDGEIGFQEGVQRARKERLADAAEKAKRDEAMLSYQSRKEAA